METASNVSSLGVPVEIYCWAGNVPVIEYWVVGNAPSAVCEGESAWLLRSFSLFALRGDVFIGYKWVFIRSRPRIRGMLFIIVKGSESLEAEQIGTWLHLTAALTLKCFPERCFCFSWPKLFKAPLSRAVARLKNTTLFSSIKGKLLTLRAGKSHLQKEEDLNLDCLETKFYIYWCTLLNLRFNFKFYDFVWYHFTSQFNLIIKKTLLREPSLCSFLLKYTEIIFLRATVLEWRLK